MRRIQLTRGKEVIVDNQDYNYLMQWLWSYNSNGYAVRRCRTRKQPYIYMHLAIGRRKGIRKPGHRNRNKLDNRRRNLRPATGSQQIINQALRRDNTSGYKGVFDMGRYSIRRKPWLAHIRYKRKRETIGYFRTKKEAARAYNKRALELFGPFAWLNPV
jgi:hypothetical protein